MDVNSLRFAKTHEWVSLDGDIATIGISDFAIKELTDIVHIEFPEVGMKVSAGEVFGEVESTKAVSDLYAPVDGEIVEVHADVEDQLEELRDDPFGIGWIIKMKVTDPSTVNSLMDRNAYEASIG